MIKKGTRVIPSGVGRTATWPKLAGTVTRVTRRTHSVGSVFVYWDGTHFEDEMLPDEVSEVTDGEKPE